jgi:hypothetical protein
MVPLRGMLTKGLRTIAPTPTAWTNPPFLFPKRSYYSCPSLKGVDERLARLRTILRPTCHPCRNTIASSRFSPTPYLAERSCTDCWLVAAIPCSFGLKSNASGVVYVMLASADKGASTRACLTGLSNCGPLMSPQEKQDAARTMAKAATLVLPQRTSNASGTVEGWPQCDRRRPSERAMRTIYVLRPSALDPIRKTSARQSPTSE